MYFSDIKGVVFQVREHYTGKKIVRDDSWLKDKDWIVKLEVYSARYVTNQSINPINGPTVKPVFQPQDLMKLSAILELCPDLFIVNKKVQVNNVISYDIEKINYNLDWIKSDFYK